MGLLTGIGRESSKGQGGLMDVRIAIFGDIATTGITVTSGGTLSFHCPANTFKQFQLSKEGGSKFMSTQTGNVANASNSWKQVLTMNFRRNQIQKRREASVLAQNEVVVIVNDNFTPTSGGTVGNLYVFGIKVGNDFGGADATSTVHDTGGQFTDANSMVVTLEALESHEAYTISAADYAKIIAGTAL
jgi:hypothetical protein